MKVVEILQKKGNAVYSVRPENTVYDAIVKMAEENIGALLVMDDSRLEGIISEKDYRSKVVLKGRTSKTTSVSEIMEDQVICVRPTDTIQLCMQLMTEKKVRHLPVIEDGDVVGVVSIGDVVKRVIEDQKVEIDSLRNFINGGGYPG
ncbi:CBS domain-containing protein [Balneola sp. MJW-20]|uniref:CBS domain-containing protein n=1 Tax=Gracilimonas aurantiaca TaxID=3234185 RepID=UPI0034665ED5